MTAPLVLMLGEQPVTMRAATARDAQVAYCHDCETVLWDSTHPYWGAAQVRAMHCRGTGHRVRLYAMDGPGDSEPT